MISLGKGGETNEILTEICLLFFTMEQLSSLTQSLVEQGYAIRENFIPSELASALLARLKLHLNKDEFTQAGIGSGGDFQKRNSIRGDEILWIPKQATEQEFVAWNNLMQVFSEELNQQLFAGIRDFEFHLAHYPIGTYYDRHLDQFKGRNNRILSCILYLNENWKLGDGGELVLYTNDKPVTIAPIFGTFVCFFSDTFEHEVLTTQVDRYSVTGWMLNYPVGLGFMGY